MGRRGRGGRGGGRRREERGAIDLIVNFPDMALEMKAMQMELAGAIRELHMKRREVEEAEAKVAALNKQVEERLRGGGQGPRPPLGPPSPCLLATRDCWRIRWGGGLTIPHLSVSLPFLWQDLRKMEQAEGPQEEKQTMQGG